jgi:hypothetical protein
MVSEFERRAWDTRTDADKNPPALALKIALDDIERGEIDPVHIIVVHVQRDDKGEWVGYLQAGDLSTFAVEGVLARAARITAESARCSD